MQVLQLEILNAALPNVLFDGWTMPTLRKAAASLDMPELEADRAFPGGVIEALNVWTDHRNTALREALGRDYNLSGMKIRERIATGVMVKLRQEQPNREAVRKALAIYGMPWHAGDGLKRLYDTLDIIWRAAGDTSTDWNFYSKRALLAKVYMSTLLVWLNDDSENQQITEAFLQRRINDVMHIQKVKFKLKGLAEKAGNFRPGFRPAQP